MNAFEKILAAIAAFLKYAPAAISAVKSVEAVVGAGNGATKLQMATAAVLAVTHAGESVSVPIVQAVSGVVETIVGVLNSAGALGKPATTTPVVVATAPLE